MSETGDFSPSAEEAARQISCLMQREVAINREILAHMQHEHGLLLANKVREIRPLTEERKELIQSLEEVRGLRLRAFKELAQRLHVQVDEENEWERQVSERLSNNMGMASCEIIWLRDQLLALLTKINEQNSRNNYLIQSRIRYTKDLMRQLAPDQGHLIYGSNGQYAPKHKVMTLTLINREG